MTPSLPRFAVRSLAWLVPCYALWYAVAGLSTAPAAWAASLIANAMQPGLVTEVEVQRNVAAFVTRIRVAAAGGGSGFAVPEVDAFIYTHGLPLFLALMLAAGTAWRWIVMGAVALVPLQAWGMAFDLLSQVYLRTDAPGARGVAMTPWKLEAIALGYQAGSLILPTLGPVALWVLFNQPFLARLAGRTRTEAPPSGPCARNLPPTESPRALPVAKGEDPCP